MPIYEYTCTRCGTSFEELVPRHDTPSQPCPSCGSKKTEKLLSVFSGHVGGRSEPGCASSCAAPGGACPSGGTCPMAS